MEIFREIFFGEAWGNYLARSIGLLAIAWGVTWILRQFIFRTRRFQRIWLRSGRTTVERQATLQSLIASAVSLLVFIVAIFIVLLQFIEPDTLLWIVGLFSAAFGLGARPQISDFLAGAGFLFEDTFSVGEKVEIMSIEGVIERVGLRTSWLRSPSGELYVIPNGEIRVVRNFSRGQFSVAKVKIKIVADDLEEALSLLENKGSEAVHLLPNLVEPWQVLNETGQIGQHADLSIIVKVRFGKAADAQPRLLSYIRETLEEEGISLVD